MRGCQGRWKQCSTASRKNGASSTSSCIPSLLPLRTPFMAAWSTYRWRDEERRYAVHHDLLRQPDRGEELQHNGRSEGRARKRRPVRFGGAWTQRDTG